MAKAKKQETEQETEIEVDPVAEKNTAQPTPEETIAKLQKDMEAETARAKAAEDRNAVLEKDRTEAVKTSITVQQQAVIMHEQALTGKLSAVKSELATLEQQLEEAADRGDSKAIARLNIQIGKASAREVQFENDKASFDTWKEQQKNQTQQQGPGPKTQAWIDKHPEFNTDTGYHKDAVNAHDVAVSRGLVPESDAYFEFIDSRLDRLYNDGQKPAQRQQRVTAAAPSRDSGTVSGKREGGRVLNSRQLEAAETCGMSPGEYAKYLDQCEKEGLMK